MLDSDGLICAFGLDPPQQLERVPASTDPAQAGPHWLHFNLSDLRARRYIERTLSIPDEARELLLEMDPRIRLQIFATGFGVVLGDLHHDFDTDPEGFGPLRLYVDADVMISARLHSLRSVDHLRRELQSSSEPMSPVQLFEQLLRHLAETIAAVSVNLNDTVEDAEDEILAGHPQDRGGRVGRVRRLLARLRRQVNANRGVLVPLRRHMPWAVTAEEKQGIREAIEHLDAVSQDLDLVTERARLLQEEIAARLSEATNRNLYVLSIVTTLLLPITLVSGVFGMNVAGMPFAHASHGFWFVSGVMAVTLLGTHLLLKRIGVL